MIAIVFFVHFLYNAKNKFVHCFFIAIPSGMKNNNPSDTPQDALTTTITTLYSPKRFLNKLPLEQARIVCRLLHFEVHSTLLSVSFELIELSIKTAASCGDRYDVSTSI